MPADQRDRVYRGVLDQLIGYKLLLQEAKARKIGVPDADVDARSPDSSSSSPSEEPFQQTLAERKMTLEQMQSRRARATSRSRRLLESEIAPKIAVKPEQVDDFYKNNPDQFKQPERVKASHILICRSRRPPTPRPRRRRRPRPSRSSRT